MCHKCVPYHCESCNIKVYNALYKVPTTNRLVCKTCIKTHTEDILKPCFNCKKNLVVPPYNICDNCFPVDCDACSRLIHDHEVITTAKGEIFCDACFSLPYPDMVKQYMESMDHKNLSETVKCRACKNRFPSEDTLPNKICPYCSEEGYRVCDKRHPILAVHVDMGNFEKCGKLFQAAPDIEYCSDCDPTVFECKACSNVFKEDYEDQDICPKCSDELCDVCIEEPKSGRSSYCDYCKTNHIDKQVCYECGKNGYTNIFGRCESCLNKLNIPGYYVCKSCGINRVYEVGHECESCGSKHFDSLQKRYGYHDGEF